MLPRANRIRSSADFARAVRRGRRAATPRVVVHLTDPVGEAPCLVGFIVSRAVGNAVTRNRVKRRLRASVAARLTLDPDRLVGRLLVIRANPSSATAEYVALDTDVQTCLGRLGAAVAA